MPRRYRDDTDDLEEIPRKRKSRANNHGVILAILAGAGIVVVGLPVVIFVMCAGMVSSVPTGPRQVTAQNAMPEIMVGEKLRATNLQFGTWREDFGSYTTTITLPAQTQRKIRYSDITVRCFGPGGVKLRDGWSKHPAIAPGESVKLDIHFPESKSEIARIVLDLDN